MPSKRKITLSRRRASLKAAKRVSMKHPSGNSNYGRKKAYLISNGGWGFEYADPKPWK